MKKVRSLIFILLVIFGIGFIAIQFIPYGRQHTNPPVLAEPKWNSDETRQIAQRACFDCHSNLTVWPWYSNIAPVSWLVARDVERGRSNMNFSEWDTMSLEVGELIEVIQEGEMPPFQYLVLHPEARLTQNEKDAYIQGLLASLQSK